MLPPHRANRERAAAILGAAANAASIGHSACRLEDATLRQRHPAFWTYLEEGKRQASETGYLTSRRSPWYSQESRPPARAVLCTSMGRPGNGRKPFRFIWNRSQAMLSTIIPDIS